MPAKVRKPVFAAVSALILVYTLVIQPPWRVGMPSESLDPSWAMVIQHAFAKGWQFGEDIIFTYGPLGFVMIPQYHEGLYAPALLYWIAFYGTFAAAICLLYRKANAALLVLPVLATLVLSFNWAHDGVWFAACFIQLLLARRDGRASAALALILTLLLAAASLMKTTALMIAVPAALLSDITRLVSRRTPPVLTPAFVLAFITLYVAAGQHMPGLGTYLANSLEVARGYGEAMQVYGSFRELAAFGLAVTATIAAILLIEQKRRSASSIVMVLLCGILFLTAKAGFVRQDVGHAMIPWVALLFIGTAYAGDSAGEPVDFPRAALLAASFVSALAVCVTYIRGARESERDGSAIAILAGDLRDQIRDDFAALPRVLFGEQMAEYRTAYAAQIDGIRARAALPFISGSLDVLGVNQAIGIAGSAEYRPRPVFQSYSVYTRSLIDLNRAALAGPRAPDVILFEIDTIDGRYPSLDEGALWPDILRHYDATDLVNGYAVLRRRTHPRTVDIVPLTETTAMFGESIDVSQWSDEPLWATIDVRSTFIGRIRSLLFKPPLVMMTVTTNAGNVQTFRIVPGMTSSGFLLSPLVESADQFAMLPEQEEKITHLSITALGRPSGMFEDAVAVTLSKLEIPKDREFRPAFDLQAVEQRRLLRALAASAGAIPGQAKGQLLPDGKVLAHAPSRLFLQVPTGAKTIEVSYGLLDGAWTDGREGDGACFRVDADKSVLHEACLDPKHLPSDRAPVSAKIDLPVDVERVTLETLPKANTDWDWTYWSDVRFK